MAFRKTFFCEFDLKFINSVPPPSSVKFSQQLSQNFRNEVCWKGKSPDCEKETFKGELKDENVFKRTQHSHELNREVGRTGRVFFFFPPASHPAKFSSTLEFFFRRKESREKISQFEPPTDTLFHLSHATHNIYVLTKTYFHSHERPASWKRVGARRGEENSQAFSFFRRRCVHKRFQSKPNIPDTQSLTTIVSLQLW